MSEAADDSQTVPAGRHVPPEVQVIIDKLAARTAELEEQIIQFEQVMEAHSDTFAALTEEAPAARQQPARPAENRRGSFFTVDDLPCPSCDQYTVIGYLLIDEHGRHQHTRYRCTFWRSGVKSDLSGARHTPCEWEGWSVPGWRSDEEAEAARARAVERGGPAPGWWVPKPAARQED